MSSGEGAVANGSGVALPGLGAPLVSASPLTPESLKAIIFRSENKRLKSRVVNFFGVQIEIRQSTLEQMFKRTTADPDGEAEKQSFAISILFSNAFIPGTDTKVFDEADEEQLLSMPYGPEFSDVVDAFRDISGIKTEEERKNSKSTQSDSASSK